MTKDDRLIIADMIDATAFSHYRRDISGPLALEHWCRVARTIREHLQTPDAADPPEDSVTPRP